MPDRRNMAECMSLTLEKRKTLLDMLDCAVCLEHYEDPRSLACLHRFCLKCLKNLEKHLQIVCPSCRATTKVPLEGVETFKKDHEFISIMSFILEENSNQHHYLLCNDCEENMPLMNVCKTCSNALCKICSKTHIKHCKTADLVSTKDIEDDSKALIAKTVFDLDKCIESFEKLTCNLVNPLTTRPQIEKEIDKYFVEVVNMIEVKKRDLLKKVEEHFNELNWNTNNRIDQITERSTSIHLLKTSLDDFKGVRFDHADKVNEKVNHIMGLIEGHLFFTNVMNSNLEQESFEKLVFTRSGWSQMRDLQLGDVYIVKKGKKTEPTMRIAVSEAKAPTSIQAETTNNVAAALKVLSKAKVVLEQQNETLMKNEAIAVGSCSTRNASGILVYTRQDLLELRHSQLSLTRPVNLPDLEIILDKPMPVPGVNENATMPLTFTPAFFQNRVSKVNLYVKNLEDGANDSLLHKEFSKFGKITSAKVMVDENGTCKGQGFVCFSNPVETKRAMEEMDGQIIMTKPLSVAFAVSSKEYDTQVCQI